MSHSHGQPLCVSRFFPTSATHNVHSIVDDHNVQQNRKRQFQNVNNSVPAGIPTNLKRRQKADDVCIHDRKYAWSLLYGKCADESQMAICFMCQCSAIGWVNASFHMAHVVPRTLCGNNTGVWNRVPVCATCNMNVESHSNLLDIVMQYFPSRVVPIALYLWHCFRHTYPRISKLYFDDNLEFFVRAVYGKLKFENDDDDDDNDDDDQMKKNEKNEDISNDGNDDVETKTKIEKTDFATSMTIELKIFLDSVLPDRTASVRRAGRIQNPRVYEALAIYDDLKLQGEVLQQQCADMCAEISRLSAQLQTNNNLLQQNKAKLESFAPSLQMRN